MKEYPNQVKLAAGGNGAGSGGPTFRAWQKVKCKILERAPGGYKVLLVDFVVIAFLQSDEQLKTDEVLMGEFLCAYDDRLLIRQAGDL